MESDTAALVTAVDAMFTELKFHEDAAEAIRVAIKSLRIKLSGAASPRVKSPRLRAARSNKGRRRGLAAVAEPEPRVGLDEVRTAELRPEDRSGLQ